MIKGDEAQRRDSALRDLERPNRAPSESTEHDHDGPTSEESQERVEAREKNNAVTLKERLKHFTFAWFTCTMATGAIATLLGSQSYTFNGLPVIGKIVFIFDLVLFVIFTAAITARFVVHRSTFRSAILHPTESLFVPTFFLSIVNIFDCAQLFGVAASGPWLPYALRVCFWTYVACVFVLSTLQYLHLFSAPPKRLTVQSMTPSWLLPIFPAMLSGTLASEIAGSQPPGPATAIIFTGITLQGLGWMVSFLMYSAYIQRLMQYGLPAPTMRPGMFIAVGPPCFTSLALIDLSRAIPSEYGYFAAHPGSSETFRSMALMVSIFLWTLGLWFFSLSLLAVLKGIQEMSFNLVWYSFIFPNVGFTIAVIYIGEELASPGVQWVGSAVTMVLIVVWLFVMVMHCKAVVTRQIMMPNADEEKEQD